MHMILVILITFCMNSSLLSMTTDVPKKRTKTTKNVPQKKRKVSAEDQLLHDIKNDDWRAVEQQLNANPSLAWNKKNISLTAQPLFVALNGIKKYSTTIAFLLLKYNRCCADLLCYEAYNRPSISIKNYFYRETLNRSLCTKARVRWEALQAAYGQLAKLQWQDGPFEEEEISDEILPCDDFIFVDPNSSTENESDEWEKLLA